MSARAGHAGGLDAQIARVVSSGACSGCGACTIIDDGLAMEYSDEGFLRPRRAARTRPPPDAERRFRATCPGVVVRAQHPPGSQYHPQLGPVIKVWVAYATDPEVRRRGASGGTLTALAAWLVETGEAARVTASAVDPGEPRRTVPVTLTSRSEALAAAGSRYAPVAACRTEALTPGSAAVGKPCEASALRALTAIDHTDAPLLLSFFCAGTPSQTATDRLVESIGVPPGTTLSSLWYRGRGWPGRFTARTTDGVEVSASYGDSWGTALGPAVQWRCKMCPDGIGESSDISAGDFWRADQHGYPLFDESDGFSALVARTERGLDVVERAAAAGVLTLRQITPDEVMAIQPMQSRRRRTVFARLVGARLAGRRVPRYRGFGLFRLAVAQPRESVRTARGTFSRARKDRSAS